MTEPFNSQSTRPISRESWFEHPTAHRSHAHLRRNGRTALRVMKFGGTSVGDASCIRRVIEIVRNHTQQGQMVVVVSAMSNVTNKLIEAALQAEMGQQKNAMSILSELRLRHQSALSELISSAVECGRISQRMDDLFEECARICESTAQRGELTPQIRDSISGMGERLSAPLIAGALTAEGLASEAIDASELVITDSYHGAADPILEITQERCEARLRPLLQSGIIPVITGFIGATKDGAVTTLGRGGSDYSATTLGEALQADEVVIWTDVDGMFTADPRLVPEASTIPEISYREAAELAYFGAKVLHPKTLRPVMRSGIPVWIRNTFSPEGVGTKITPTGHPCHDGVKALAAVAEAALITLTGFGQENAPEIIKRVLTATAAIRADVLLISRSAPGDCLRVVLEASSVQRAMPALQREFHADPAFSGSPQVNIESAISVLTVVGLNLTAVREIVTRAVAELRKDNIEVLALEDGSSDCNISFVIQRKDVQAALTTTHREFQLQNLNSPRNESFTAWQW
jgi:bifunctional aspartokinase / homoserine dehydrogenase 1